MPALLPVGTKIYYDLSPGPDAGPGYFDNNIFVFVNTRRWAVGRCTGPNNISLPGKVGLCTLTDGVGLLTGFSARVKVTHKHDINNPDNNALFAWDGPYDLDPARED